MTCACDDREAEFYKFEDKVYLGVGDYVRQCRPRLDESGSMGQNPKVRLSALLQLQMFLDKRISSG